MPSTENIQLNYVNIFEHFKKADNQIGGDHPSHYHLDPSTRKWCACVKIGGDVYWGVEWQEDFGKLTWIFAA